MRKVTYFHRILISIDQFFNTLLGGFPDETISSRLGKLARAGNPYAKAACWLIGKLLFQDTRHCAGAIEEDEGAG